MIRFLLILMLALMGASASAQRPAQPDHITYTVKAGDTLIGLAQRGFRRQADYVVAQRLNGVRNPRALRIGSTLYVGLSTRTDATGIQSLHSISHAIDFEVVQAELRDCLHLKTGATFAGPDQAGTPVLLYSPRSVDPAQFAGVDPLATADNEPDAANCLRVGNRLILPAGNPRTADRLRARGFNVVEVDVSELQKAEAGVTCMSLIA